MSIQQAVAANQDGLSAAGAAELSFFIATAETAAVLLWRPPAPPVVALGFRS